jgi:hypothetical protein
MKIHGSELGSSLPLIQLFENEDWSSDSIQASLAEVSTMPLAWDRRRRTWTPR